jgi:hypothetical protein
MMIGDHGDGGRWRGDVEGAACCGCAGGGGRKVTAAAGHLVEMAQRTSILIEVIPLDVGAHEGVNGAFVIADFADAPSIVYLETALTGLVVERPEDVAAVALSYETLRAEALSRSGSLDKLKQQHDR